MTMRSTVRRRVARTSLGASILAVLLAATACSSSSASGSGKGSSSGPATRSSATSSPSATGTPIVVGGVGPLDNPVLSQPERQGALNAAAAVINAAGGINGHPVKIDFCNTLNTVNGEVTCMRNLVSDKVSAILAPGIINDQTGVGYTFATKAGIPVIGGQGLSPTEFTTANIFPMASGIPGWSYGAIEAVLQAGAKKVAFLDATTDAAESFIQGLNSGAMKLAGQTPAGLVVADPNADPTLASAAARVIAGGVDAVVIDCPPTLMPRAVSALVGAGYKGLISSITPLFGADTLKSLGSQANGVLLTGQLAWTSDTQNPAVAAFLAAMKKYAPNDEVNETSEDTYAAFQLFAKVAASAAGTTSADILTAMQNISSPIDVGLAGPYQVKGVTAYLSDFPNMYNPTVQNGIVRNGVLVADGKGFINPFTKLKEFGH
jgi:branched-chain amino acid transport system substrate-binding protein